MIVRMNAGDECACVFARTRVYVCMYARIKVVCGVVVYTSRVHWYVCVSAWQECSPHGHRSCSGCLRAQSDAIQGPC